MARQARGSSTASEQLAGLKSQDALLADPNSKRPGFTPKYAENESVARDDDDGAVDPNLPPDPSRRFWVTTACAVGGVAGSNSRAAGQHVFPSEKARAAGAPVEVDIGDIPSAR